jgi:hypothetical protein
MIELKELSEFLSYFQLRVAGALAGRMHIRMKIIESGLGSRSCSSLKAES